MSSEPLGYLPDDDGMTFPAYIQPRAGVYPAVRLDYRPTHLLDRAVFIEQSARLTEAEMTELTVRALERRIQKWSLLEKDKDGNLVPMPIEQKRIRRLEPTLYTRLADIVVWGNSRGDIDPDVKKSEREDAVKASVDAAIEGTKISDKLIEAKEKNS